MTRTLTCTLCQYLLSQLTYLLHITAPKPGGTANRIFLCYYRKRKKNQLAVSDERTAMYNLAAELKYQILKEETSGGNDRAWAASALIVQINVL